MKIQEEKWGEFLGACVPEWGLLAGFSMAGGLEAGPGTSRMKDLVTSLLVTFIFLLKHCVL